MAAVVVCVVAAGCGSVRAPGHPPGTLAIPRTGQTATAAGNRAAAQAEAAWLLSLARVPPGAVRLTGPARSLPGAPLSKPAVTSLVDQAAAWRVRSPFATVRAWLPAHPPRGLRSAGSASAGNGRTGQASMVGAIYHGPTSAAWKSADLEISVVPAGPDASLIRADAVIVWLDPHPLSSGPGAHPVRVTVAGGCPPTDRAVTGVTNPGTGLTRRLLPPGPPVNGLRCQYDGSNGHPWHLVATQRLTAPAARQAATSMAHRPLSHTDGGSVNCSEDDGSAQVLALAYRGRPDIDLWITLNGCGGVSNGHITTGGL